VNHVFLHRGSQDPLRYSPAHFATLNSPQTLKTQHITISRSFRPLYLTDDGHDVDRGLEGLVGEAGLTEHHPGVADQVAGQREARPRLPH